LPLTWRARCSTITFTALESTASQSVTLFTSTQTLWHSAGSGSPSSSAQLASAQLPSTLPFSFALTADLPHCIHLPSSGISYALSATLHSASAGDVRCSVPVHLTRYTRPGPLAALSSSSSPRRGAVEPHVWAVSSPTPLAIQLRRTLFRRAEPMEVRVRIPPPQQTLVAEKGLRLKAVEASLLRVITVRDGHSSATVATASAADGKAREEAPRYTETQELGAGSSSAGTSGESSGRFESLLAHSGKLCRFHSRHPILLRLALHPPFDISNMPYPHPDHDAARGGPVAARVGGGGCESVSQETLLHTVDFVVRVRVVMRGGQGEDRDVLVEKTVDVLPGAAGLHEGEEEDADEDMVSERRSEKERLRRDEEAGASRAGGSGSSGASFEEFGSDQEYDGYEDVGRSLHARRHRDEAAGGSSLNAPRAHSDGHLGDETLDVSMLLYDSANSDTASPSSPGSALPLFSHDEQPPHAFADARGGAQDAEDDAPPSLLESRHDLQLQLAPPAHGDAHDGAQTEASYTINDASHPPLDADLSGYAPRDEVARYTMTPRLLPPSLNTPHAAIGARLSSRVVPRSSIVETSLASSSTNAGASLPHQPEHAQQHAREDAEPPPGYAAPPFPAPPPLLLSPPASAGEQGHAHAQQRPPAYPAAAAPLGPPSYEA
jgi:hypothetical protein